MPGNLLTPLPLVQVPQRTDERAALVRRAKLLAWVGLGWHGVEATIAIAAGVAAGSIALIGFGADSMIESVAGFIAACAYVRPEGIEGMKPKSVKKKLKQPSFAAGVHRDEVYRGAEELEPESGMSFDEHVQFVIDALVPHADELGLAGKEVG